MYQKYACELKDHFFHRCLLVAVRDSSVIGFVVGSFLEGDGSALLENLAVKANWRRKGVASTLCAALSDWARAEGASLVYPANEPLPRWGDCLHKVALFGDAIEGPLAPWPEGRHLGHLAWAMAITAKDVRTQRRTGCRELFKASAPSDIRNDRFSAKQTSAPTQHAKRFV